MRRTVNLKNESTVAALRFQISNSSEFKNISTERAFADWLFCNVILHSFVISFMG